MSTPVVREYIADFLLQVLQAHGLSCEPCDEVARRLCRRAEAQVAQQVEQLFEHLPPHRSQKSAGCIASSLSPRLTTSRR
jgi:hypothetical protein